MPACLHVALAAILMLGWLPGTTRAAALTEQQIKAAYMLNFARFVEWPPVGNRSAIILGVLGADPFGEVLDTTLSGKTVRGKPFSVRRFRSMQEIEDCDLLYVSASETARIPAVIAHFTRVPVLTVSDAKDFVETGGAIGFVTVGDRIRFDINLRALASAGLKASAQLLEVARVLKGSK